MKSVKPLVGFLILLVTLLSGLSYWMGQRMAVRYLPLIDAAMEIRLEATTAHLWLEEIISGDRGEDVESVWEHLDQADWYARAMLEGGVNNEGNFEPLVEPKLVEKIKIVQVLLAEFRRIAHLRLENIEGTSGVGSLSDQEFDKVFANFILHADEVESELQTQIDLSLAKYKLIQINLLLGILILSGILFWLLYRFDKQSKEMVFLANRANKEKSRFLTMMSHELRTPMNGVLGMTQLLQDSKLNEDQQRFCNIILESGQSLITILSDILDLSKIEANHEAVVLEPFSLNEVIRANIELFSGAASAKRINLAYQGDTRVKDFVIGDAEIFRRILSNLLGNAIKFTEVGEIQVITQLLEITQDQQQIRFEVRDTGIGISAEHQELIFEPFCQGAENTTRKYGGTGLGLSIVKGLVNLLGGEIEAKSEGISGSSFVFDLTFPIFQIETLKGVAEPKMVAIETQNFSHLKLLVVEDDVINAQVLGGMLTLQEIPFDLAKHGREALDLSRQQQYDLILMDLLMPDMNGFEATEKIKSEATSLNRETPIIAVTAMVGLEEKERCFAVGMKEVLSKPLDFELLKEAIFKYTEKSA
ncbi:MAG: ATP-binding protein [SAR324 cluster bacterium]|nr:ATP-binding protein [SAR324 cluster bacterium]